MAITLDQLFTDVAEKHLAGKHNQKDHGRPRGGAQGQLISSSNGREEESSFAHVHHIRRERGPDKEVTRELKNGQKRTKKVATYKFYDSETGKEITDKKTLDRMPRGWPGALEVLINPDPNGELIATWKSVKHKIQRVYSKEHDQGSAAEKFQRLKDFNKALPKMRRQVREDLKSDDPIRRDVAAIVLLIDRTAFRLGGLGDTRADVQAYGASTLLNKHVKVDGNKLTFDFIGKKGVRIRQSLRDKELAEEVQKRKTNNWSQPLWAVEPHQVHRYIKRISNLQFSAKDYRTWNATNMAWSLVKKRKGPASTELQFAKWQKDVANKVAKKLGNSGGVVIGNYIDFHVWDIWRQPSWGPYIPKKLKDDD